MQIQTSCQATQNSEEVKTADDLQTSAAEAGLRALYVRRVVRPSLTQSGCHHIFLSVGFLWAEPHLHPAATALTWKIPKTSSHGIAECVCVCVQINVTCLLLSDKTHLV